MWMLTELSCVLTQPTLLCAPDAFSCTFFFALYVPPFGMLRIQVESCRPQSLNGTPLRPAVQSRRGSRVMAAVYVPVLSLSSAFQLADVGSSENAAGSPSGAVWKKFTRFCDGWWKPQQPNGLPECGKLRRSPAFALLPFGSPSFADA